MSRRDALGVAVVVVLSLALGALTSYAQGWLPDSLRSLANSVSGWTALTALVVGLLRPGLALGAVLGAVSFVCLVLGYTAASELRGFAYDPVLWSVVGVVAGPFVGAAAASLSGARRRTALVGAGLLAAVLVADGVRGLTVLSASTSPVYWSLAIVTGLLLLSWAWCARAGRCRSRRPR